MWGNDTRGVRVGGRESGNDLNLCMEFSNKIIKYIY